MTAAQAGLHVFIKSARLHKFGRLAFHVAAADAEMPAAEVQDGAIARNGRTEEPQYQDVLSKQVVSHSIYGPDERESTHAPRITLVAYGPCAWQQTVLIKYKFEDRLAYLGQCVFLKSQ